MEPPFKVKWRFNGRKLLEYSPILVDGSLYVVNNNGEAFSVKTRNGQDPLAQARSRASTPPRPPTATGSIFIANLEPGQVQALNAKNGIALVEARAAGPHRVLAGRRRRAR